MSQKDKVALERHGQIFGIALDKNSITSRFKRIQKLRGKLSNVGNKKSKQIVRQEIKRLEKKIYIMWNKNHASKSNSPMKAKKLKVEPQSPQKKSFVPSIEMNLRPLMKLDK